LLVRDHYPDLGASVGFPAAATGRIPGAVAAVTGICWLPACRLPIGWLPASQLPLCWLHSPVRWLRCPARIGRIISQ
jgi:hypothetical protein